jgi:hypothetical protein
MRRMGLVVALVCVPALASLAQDPTKIAPNGYKVEGENDLVRIVRMQRGPHDKAPMHEHPSFVVVFLKDMHQKVTDGDGTVRENSRKAGEFSWNDPRKHAEENLSDQPMESLLVELKPKALDGVTQMVPASLDSAKVDPKHYKVEFENDTVRVLRLKRGPLESTGMHEHPNYVAIFLTDIHLKITDSDGKVREVSRKRGEFAINPPTKHEELTLAGPPMEVLVVELKKTALPTF